MTFSQALFLLIGIACLSPLVVDGASTVLFSETFTKPIVPGATGSNYVWYTRKTYVVNDGKLTINSNKTVTHSVNPFKKTDASPNDRYKSIVLTKKFFNVSKTQALTCELKAWTKQFGVTKHPFKTAVTDPNNDPRLATCGMWMLDTNSYVLVHFLQTNKENMPKYARSGSGQNKTGPLGFYHAFDQFKTGVSKRSSPYTYTDLSITYNRKAGTFTWSANGKAVYSVSSIGLPAFTASLVQDTGGATTKAVSPTGFQCGFGCWDFLDFTDASNTKSKAGLVKLSNSTGYYTSPTSFVDPLDKLSSRLFGQGTVSNYASFKVSIASA